MVTQNDFDNGRMICLIGVAAVKPAEFVIFRIGQWTGSQLYDAGFQEVSGIGMAMEELVLACEGLERE